jgi:hypothetical protein
LSDQCVHSIKAAVFEGLNKTMFRDRREFGGSLLKQLNDVYAYIEQYNRTKAEFSGLYYADENYGSYTFNSDTKHGVGWKSIGFSEYNNPCPFQGTFDGGNHTVSGLVMENAAASGFGLFGYMEGTSSSKATIKNLIIDSCKVKGFSDIGGVVERASGNTSISNCFVTGASALSGSVVGGIVGSSYDVAVTNCHVTGDTVTGYGNAGGVIAYSGGNVTNCSTTCAVTATNGYPVLVYEYIFVIYSLT